MAPPDARGSDTTPISVPQLKSTIMNNSISPPTKNKLPSLAEDEVSPKMAPLTSQVTQESEGDLESENELPELTPPSIRHGPVRVRNSSPLQYGYASNFIGGGFAPMQRAHSSPGIDSTGRIITSAHTHPRRPPSPLSSGRRRSPLRSAFEESYLGPSWSSISIEPNIPEHAELELSTPATPENEYSNFSSIPTHSSISSTFPRSRRRPASPLHQSASAPSLHASARAATITQTSGSSPSLTPMSAARYANEPYPPYGYSYSSNSSMPSTPTSLRSRSPSISSLETIEDTPDAEEAAMMDEDAGNKRFGAEDTEAGSESRRKGLDIRGAGLRSNKDRKRWSVCGAERRADFSLEVIEE